MRALLLVVAVNHYVMFKGPLPTWKTELLDYLRRATPAGALVWEKTIER